MSIRRLSLTAGIAKCAMYVLLATACARAEAIEKVPVGTEVTVRTADGTLVRGKIADVNASTLTLTGESPNTTTEITRTSIAEVKRVEADTHVANAPEPKAEVKERAPEAP